MTQPTLRRKYAKNRHIHVNGVPVWMLVCFGELSVKRDLPNFVS